MAQSHTDLDSGAEPELVFHTLGLTKTYAQDGVPVHALRGVDIDIPKGELVVLLGPSGSGKSTLLNILGGLDAASTGQAFFMDQALTDMSEAELTQYRRRHVGFVFQFYNLMPSLTARENVELVTEIAEAPMSAERALELVGLGHRMDHFPSQLSGGEQQRVAIARAIAKQPSVLFCDEPTGALDSATGRTVLKVLQDINRETKASILIVTHAAATAEMAHRVIHFADGQISRAIVNANQVSAEALQW